ncbi:hypothetical protein [Paraburkholderia terricola]|uniref:hypothetical protein n=1 Tax=Paraburkholderia terricola TaxID=169427 RepID=UPI000A0DCD0F|nr:MULTISPECIES: hypothetical protein [Paraburkholderia]ORC49656.1 hypothetical protein B2G74_16990 [Burkholderia sp. A27]
MQALLVVVAVLLDGNDAAAKQWTSPAAASSDATAIRRAILITPSDSIVARTGARRRAPVQGRTKTPNENAD